MIKGSDIFSLDSSMLEEKDLANQLQIKIWEKLSKFQWMPFKEAREFIRTFVFKKQADFFKYMRSENRRTDIPVKAQRVYKDKGWLSWGDFLGYQIGFDGKYRSFIDARKFVRSLKLKSIAEWDAYCDSGKKPHDIPFSGYQTYKNDGWINTGDWLGHDRVPPQFKKYREYIKAREFVNSLGLQTQKEWTNYCASGKKPDDIPSNPRNTYKNKGWTGFREWLGNNRYSAKYKQENRWSFKKAREFVRSLGLNSTKEWAEYCNSGKKPVEIPTNVSRVYKNEGWIGMPDWIGTHPGWNGKARTFNEARVFVRGLGLKNRKEWREYCRSANKAPGIILNAERKYENKGWKGWDDFLGIK